MTSSNLSRSKAVLSDEGSLLVSDATGDGNALQVGQRQVTVNLGRRSNSGEKSLAEIFCYKSIIITLPMMLAILLRNSRIKDSDCENPKMR
jgi:hypothetical protein